MVLNFDIFFGRLVNSGIARPDELHGCSDEEIAVFEQKYHLVPPETYRQFLSRMGHSAGKLFAWDHVETSYPAVLSMQDELYPPRESPDQDQDEEWEESLLSSVSLPEKSLVILGHLDDQYHFLICDRPDDSPVYYFSEEGGPPEKIYDSVMDWLEDWRKGAEEAIRSGYFDTE